ncbi:uncharacterized protein LOC124796186 [Schistocerca piceifrons]|uniref:uncharacterized protein LOC124796186 n=1 Tax=Schistocerca piceifrons TaxID=274613 RepID=UPI001F5EFC23|nr:uncharacterized protein LOC124796186 [Schistocerca piceifrons]
MTETHHSEQLRGDDVFANSSNETVVENVDYSLVLKEAGEFLNTLCTGDACRNSFPVASPVKDETGKVELETHNSSVNRSLFPDYDGQVDVSFTVNQLIVHSSNLPRRLFCPFCTQHYGFEFLLKEHIKKFHTLEIETFVINSKNLQFHPCPICQAKFYLTDLLMKHVMYRHQECVLNILREASPNQYVNCRFCPFRVWKKQEKELLIHVENKHLKSFETVFIEKYSDTLDPENDCDESTAKEIFYYPKARSPPTTLLMDSAFEHQQAKNGVQKSILKNRLTCEEGDHLKKGTDVQYFTARSEAVKRRLHYEIDSDDKRESNDTCAIKSISVGHPQKRSRWKALFKKMRRPRSIPKRCFVTSTPYANSARNQRNFFVDGESEAHCVCSSATSPAKRVKFSLMETDKNLNEEHGILLNTSKKLQPSNEIEPILKQFKCALCLQAFISNNELLNHTRHKHSGPFNLLRPRYRCGECEAKFYKNSYLLRHCKFHHTPLCLRNRKH